VIGKLAASWQQVGSKLATERQRRQEMKRERPEGRKEPFGCSFLLRRQFLSALFLCYSYSFLAFFSLFVARKGGRKGGEGEKRG
jgi:hypothetical protein